MAAQTDIYQKLVHGLSMKKKNSKADEDLVHTKVDNFTVNKESFQLNDSDKEIFNGTLKFVNTHQILNSPDILTDRTEAETKAVHRMRESLGKFLKQNNMKVLGDHVPLPNLDFKDFVKYDCFI
jgi:hypothetical protein